MLYADEIMKLERTLDALEQHTRYPVPECIEKLHLKNPREVIALKMMYRNMPNMLDIILFDVPEHCEISRRKGTILELTRMPVPPEIQVKLKAKMEEIQNSQALQDRSCQD